MTGPDRKRRRLGARLAVGGVSLTLALAPGAGIPPALSATAAARGTTHASHAHRGKCARHARRHRRLHRRCTSRHRSALDAPSAPALVPPYGPLAQPGASIAPLRVPLAPVAPGPASECATPGPGAGEVGEPPVVPHVQVSAVEYAFTLSRTTVPAGKVIFQFVNNGQDEHNLQIAPSEGPLVGFFADTPSKGIGDLALEIQPGAYTLLCSLPTHEQKGMKATLTVE